MAVVIDDGDAVPFAGPGEAAPYAAKTGKGLADHRVAQSKFMRHRDRRGGVERVVPSWHRQHEIGDLMPGAGLAVAERHLEGGTGIHRREIEQPCIGLRIFAISDDAAVLDLADNCLYDGMIDAHHRET